MLSIITLLPDQPSFTEVVTRYLPFQVAGFLVVMVVLSLLYGLSAAIGRRFRDSVASKSARSPGEAALLEIKSATALPPASAAAPAAGDELALAAVIAAAVATVIEGPHRVLSIQQAETGSPFVNAWAIEGRFQHFSSHKIR